MPWLYSSRLCIHIATTDEVGICSITLFSKATSGTILVYRDLVCHHEADNESKWRNS
jgi:hypothetical protein